jgi:protein phosphatase
MRPEIDFASQAIKGQREDQEDFHAYEKVGDRLLFVLADGAGGQAAGEQASRNAAMGFLDHFLQSEHPTAPTLFASLYEGNRRLGAYIQEDPENRATMATTLLAAVLEQDQLQWISVGDSPLLLFRDNRLERLNADHSVAVTNGEAASARTALRSALVGERINIMDWRRKPFPLQENDIILAASDGLWTLTPAEIAMHLSMITSQSAAVITHELLELIQSKAKLTQDNVTVGIMKFSA